jgi:hypothetical protein
MPSIHCSGSQLVTDPCSHHSVSRYASRHRLRRPERLTRSSTLTLVAENRGHVARKLPCLSHTVWQRTNPAGRGHSVVNSAPWRVFKYCSLAMGTGAICDKGAQHGWPAACSAKPRCAQRRRPGGARRIRGSYPVHRAVGVHPCLNATGTTMSVWLVGGEPTGRAVATPLPHRPVAAGASKAPGIRLPARPAGWTLSRSPQPREAARILRDEVCNRSYDGKPPLECRSGLNRSWLLATGCRR